MPWLRIDDQFAEHPKISQLSDGAFRFHVTALCYCARNLTDGKLDARAVAVIAAICDTRPKRRVTELSDAGLWSEDATEAGTYWIKNYTEYNPTKQQVEDERKQAAERMRRLRADRSSPARSPERSGTRTPARSGTPSHPLVGDNPPRTTTTWQPALGERDPVASVRTQIANGVIADDVDLEAELAAHKALTDQQRDTLRAELRRRLEAA